jgi:nitrate reductase NapE component
MKEEQDVSETAPPEEESKTKKYLYIAFGYFMLAIIALVVVLAIIRR